MSSRTDEMREAWSERARRLGPTQRSVLFKGLPSWLNERVHRSHAAFVSANLPEGAAAILDVGCGYGRISREIRRRFPAVSCHGVELCPEFGRAYEAEFGRCFVGPIQEFRPDRTHDAVVLVTLLMYLEPEEHVPILRRLWAAVRPGGTLIAIEPVAGFLWKRLTGKERRPTGGTVHYFAAGELESALAGLDGARVRSVKKIGFLPFIGWTTVHRGVAVQKSRPGPGENEHAVGTRCWK